MAKVKFQRRTGERFSKLGKGRKKKQKWRKPTGRDNKMRGKRKGYPAVVSIGYKEEKNSRSKYIKVYNIKDLENIEKGKTILVGKIGNKKKIKLLQEAKKKGILVYRTNIEKFVKKNTKQPKKIKEIEKSKDKKNEEKHKDKKRGEKSESKLKIEEDKK